MTRFTQSITLWRFTFSIIAHLYLRYLGSRAPMWGIYYIKWILLFFSISLQRSELSRSNSYLNMSSLRAMLRQKLLLTSHHVTSRFVKVNLLNNKSTPMILRITMGKFIDMIKICLLWENFPLFGVKMNEILIKNLYHMKYIT